MENLMLRAEIYKQFSLMLNKPQESDWIDSEFIASFCELFANLNLSSDCEESALLETFNRMSFDDILLEYSRLFLGPFKVLVPPYGSCYLDEQKQLNQESTVQVEKYYSEFSLNISESFFDLPDHIVPELEFMHFLILSEIEPEENSEKNSDEYRSAQKEFFFKYFFPFAGEFCSDIITKTTSEFYKSLAKILVSFLHIEKDRLVVNQ